jgi:hypothetical protein
MTAVQLNYQPFFATAEVNDVTTDHELARELETSKLTLSQLLPQLVFRWRRVTAQRASSMGHFCAIRVIHICTR